MVLERKYQHPQNAIASYDYTDIDAGVGIVNYYGYKADISGGATPQYRLSSNAGQYTQEVETVDTTTGIADTPPVTKTLDLQFYGEEFETTKRVSGTIIVTATLGFLFNSINTVTTQAKVLLYKYDGLALIPIGEEWSVSDDQASSNSWQSKTFVIPIDADVTFNKGDSIMANVEHWAHTTGSGASVDTAIAHSPTEDTDNIDPSTQKSITTQMVVSVPFDIDIG